MQHRYVATTLGLFALGWLGLSAEAFASSPVGYWLKEDGAAKLEISICGNNQLCSKIVWLRDPHNDQGEPLHDARNENPALRNRTIIGLPIFQGLVPAGGNTWKGQIYNPEDGGTYKATLTLAGANQIVLKGCLAMFLCGQKTWTRTEFNPTPDEPEEIEVKDEVEEDSQPEAVEAKAESTPEKPSQVEANAGAAPSASSPDAEVAQAKFRELKPALPPASRDATAGYGFVLTTASIDKAPTIGNSSPSKMYLVSFDADGNQADVRTVSSEPTGAVANRQATTPESAPDQSGLQQTASTTNVTMADAATADATGMGAIEPGESVPLPTQRPPELDSYAQAQSQTSQENMSWRDRRRLRKLRREMPWMGGQTAAQAAPTQRLAPPQGRQSYSLSFR